MRTWKKKDEWRCWEISHATAAATTAEHAAAAGWSQWHVKGGLIWHGHYFATVNSK